MPLALPAAAQTTSMEVRSWQAHVCPVRSLAQVGGLVYSLARDGSIKGWSAVAPSEQHLQAWRDAVRGTCC